MKISTGVAELVRVGEANGDGGWLGDVGCVGNGDVGCVGVLELSPQAATVISKSSARANRTSL
jgi:hypothetical protein